MGVNVGTLLGEALGLADAKNFGLVVGFIVEFEDGPVL